MELLVWVFMIRSQRNWEIVMEVMQFLCTRRLPLQWSRVLWEVLLVTLLILQWFVCRLMGRLLLNNVVVTLMYLPPSVVLWRRRDWWLCGEVRFPWYVVLLQWMLVCWLLTIKARSCWLLIPELERLRVYWLRLFLVSCVLLLPFHLIWLSAVWWTCVLILLLVPSPTRISSIVPGRFSSRKE